ncbi:MAG: SDR family NAD(P)-dependent oxidoreductase [Gammaproteobacteria bacterium]|nr:SDR family NAD(P)-dependent oxidoreductase [Gammaproteobacteria bacterium]
MQKTILVTGATDGIGLATAEQLVELGHYVLLHGRNRKKLDATETTLAALPGTGKVESYVADLSRIAEVESLATAVAEKHKKLDVLINNAGVYNARDPITADGLDVRFVVNTLAPYVLTQRLLRLLGKTGRVVNVSSAAQSPVNLKALRGEKSLSDHAAYAQSKLAITAWSRHLAQSLKSGPMIVAVNPGSLLASKMVKQAFGVAGSDISIGADILCRASLDDEFAHASGEYFDNDAGDFGPPHRDALDAGKTQKIVQTIETVLAELQ